ncbi:MAG: shikimate dehydrogenase [Elusimicrobia bacterium GWA2_69_24]|nr:MAG: shikimate dehydrogenase [Elusimicrobia bacterium GWA2_69_24]
MTPRAALIGMTVEHSFSPRIFAAFAAALRRPLRYAAIPVRPDEFVELLGRARRGRWLGWNVTAPHKETAALLADGLDPVAEAAGAVNVVRFQAGRAMGYNTDVAGFLEPLQRREIALRGRPAVVLGAGGAARAVCEALRRSSVAGITIINRTLAHAEPLAERFGAGAAATGTDAAASALAEADLIVNATSAGAETPLLPPGLRLKAGSWACDLAYRPADTLFMAAARHAGASALGGMEMLVAQAAGTWRLWFGEPVPENVLADVRADLRETLS